MSRPIAANTDDTCENPAGPAQAGSATGGRPSPFHASVDWQARHGSAARRVLHLAERLSLALEAPVDWLVRFPWYNPLYHTGTLTVFLLLVILLTGLYLTFFYQFGFDESYLAVARIEANLIGRLMRALHRYASDAAVIVALLHGWRMFFQDRFRGPRWLAWVTGMAMAVSIWAIGVTGYWLIWDERAALLNQSLIDLLQGASWGRAFLVNYLASPRAGTGWLFLLLVITVHLGLSAGVGLLLWYHLRRLNRPKWLPPGYWSGAAGILLTLVSWVAPAGMLAQANFARLPATQPLDLFYLAYLPAALQIAPWLFWGGGVLLAALLAAIPWLPGRRPLAPLRVDADRCTGCTLCATDCPYQALSMAERSDGRPHKLVAVLDPNLCVSCGVCIGACPDFALALGDQPAEALWQHTLAQVQRAEKPVKIIFTCERHAFQGARRYLSPGEVETAHDGKGSHVRVIPLTCVGMAHPDLLGEALKAGASQVQIIGCPPEDCANREGNTWMQQRLERQRLPRLRREFEAAAISSDWVTPNRFLSAVRADRRQPVASAYSLAFSWKNWRSFAPALALLAIILLLQVKLSRAPVRVLPEQRAWVQITMQHRSGYPLLGWEHSMVQQPENLSNPTRLIVKVDGETLLEKEYPAAGSERFADVLARLALPVGVHSLQVTVLDRPAQREPVVLHEGEVHLQEDQVLLLDYTDTHIGGDPLEGEKLYFEASLGTNAGCRICHSLEPDVILVGPSFAGLAERAAHRVPGLSAEQYIRQSILEPDAYIVPGFPAGQMVPGLGEALTAQQLDDLVAFLLSLK